MSEARSEHVGLYPSYWRKTGAQGELAQMQFKQVGTRELAGEQENTR